MNGCRFEKFYTSVCDSNFPVSLPISSHVYLLFPLRGHEPPSPLRGRFNPYLSLQRRRFPKHPLCQTRGYRYVRNRSTLSLFHSVFSTLHPSRVPSTIRSRSCPPVIGMSASAYKWFLVRNVVLMLSHGVISRAQLYEIIRWSGLSSCAPAM